MGLHTRDFLKSLGGTSLTGLFAADRLATFGSLSAAELATRADFWDTIRASYRLTPAYINLENGYYSMQAEPVLERFIGHGREVNLLAARYMRTAQADNKRRAQERLAQVAVVRRTNSSSPAIPPNPWIRWFPVSTGSQATKLWWPWTTTGPCWTNSP